MRRRNMCSQGWKADFTYFPSAENKARFGDYFSKSKWIKSSLNAAALGFQSQPPKGGTAERCPPTTVILLIPQCKCTDLEAVLKHLSPACRSTCPAHFFAAIQKTVDKQRGIEVFDTC